MLTRPFILLLLFAQSFSSSTNVGKMQILRVEEEVIDSDQAEVDKVYKELSNSQKVDLLLNQPVQIEGKSYLSNTFKINDQTSILAKQIPYLKNEKALDLWTLEFDPNKGNLIPFQGLSAMDITHQDFVSESPLERAKLIHTYNKKFQEKGLSLLLTSFWGELANVKDQNVAQSEWLSAIRQLPKESFLLSYDSLFEEIGTLYKGSLQKSIESFRSDYNFEGLLIHRPDGSSVQKVMTALLSGVDLYLGNDPKFLSELKETLLSRMSKKPSLIENQVKRILSYRLKIHRKTKLVKEETLDKDQLEMQVKSASLVCIKNDADFLPIRDLNQSFSVEGFAGRELDLIYNYILPKAGKTDVKLLKASSGNFPEIYKTAQYDSAKTKVLVIDAQTLYKHRTRDLSIFSQILVLPEDDELSAQLAIQAVFGSFDIKGRLPFFLSPEYKNNTCIETKNLQRLRYLAPKYIGLSETILLAADSIVNEALDNGTFPGCQVLFAWKNTVVYQKSFGYISSSKKETTNNRVLYDIASVSKIAGSTCALMHLDGNGKFSLNKKLKDYLPQLMEGSSLQHLVLKDMMAHQAGLPSWIPFYTKTLKNNKLNTEFYSKDSTKTKGIEVAKDLYLLNTYPDSIYQRILDARLGQKKYLYSDLGYYFVKKIVESEGGLDFDQYLYQNIYRPLGLQNMQFNPYKKVDLKNIAPTEDDQIFRQQLIHGYVHDPGAAMLGGVGGHAGLFCNSNDLAILMQMLLNGGSYGGQTILNGNKIKEYTSVQFPQTNRRGAGFDKPTLSGKGGTACDEASAESYGHSGFTGTLTWADPKYDINYVFLSNRVNPDSENWKIVKTNVRTRIQSVWYKAVKSSQLVDYTQYL